MNLSIGHYQLVRRLRQGILLLRSTDMSVTEIAEKVGFASANGFHARHQTGMSRINPERLPQWRENVMFCLFLFSPEPVKSCENGRSEFDVFRFEQYING